jgi:hypothetical protein
VHRSLSMHDRPDQSLSIRRGVSPPESNGATIFVRPAADTANIKVVILERELY